MNVFIAYNKKGFSLVELAIVIVIIGVLIGAVLKGQQLVNQARLTSTVAQSQSYRSALNTFKSTFFELPGDMVNVDNRLPDCSGCTATQSQTSLGDGWVGASLLGSLGSTDHEVVRFWLHLYKAGMISGVNDAALTGSNIGLGTTHPETPMGGMFIVETAGNTAGSGYCGSGAGYVMWGPDGCGPKPGVILMLHKFNHPSDFWQTGNYRVLSPLEAAQIDQKMDDGKPLSGRVRGASIESSALYGCANSDEKYPEAETNKKICSLGIMIEN